MTTVMGSAIVRRYLQNELRPPRLVHGRSESPFDGSNTEEATAVPPEDRQRLLEVMLLLRDYWPHPVLEFSGYTSTFWSGLWAVLPTSSSGNKEFLTLRDGGTVSLHWSMEPSTPAALSGNSGIVLVLPGLNNDSCTYFVQGSMEHLRDHGFQAVAVNYRGVGDLDLTSPKVGGADSWQDIVEIVAHIENRHPGVPLFAVGFSMGAMILLRYLGERGAHARLRAAVALAAPVDMNAAAASLESSLKKRSINFMMVSGLKMLMFRKIWRSEYRSEVDFGGMLRARTMRQFEEASICRLHGYKDAEEYYTTNNPRSVLPHIDVPTLIVNAEDDPVVSVSTLPMEELGGNRRIFVAITRRGGHIGWGSGGLGVRSWTDSMAAQFLRLHSSETTPPVAQSRL